MEGPPALRARVRAELALRDKCWPVRAAVPSVLFCFHRGSNSLTLRRLAGGGPSKCELRGEGCETAGRPTAADPTPDHPLHAAFWVGGRSASRVEHSAPTARHLLREFRVDSSYRDLEPVDRP